MGRFVNLVAGTICIRRSHPAKVGTATGLSAGATRRSRVSKPAAQAELRIVPPDLVAGPDQNTGANAEGTTAPQRRDLAGSKPDTPARLRDRSHSLFPLVAPALLEDSSVGRAAGYYPVLRVRPPLLQPDIPGGIPGGLQSRKPVCPIPSPPDLKHPGECRAALQPSTLVVAGSSPAAPSKLVGA